MQMKKITITEKIEIEMWKLFNKPISEICKFIIGAEKKLMERGFKRDEIKLIDESVYEDVHYVVMGNRLETNTEYKNRLQKLLDGKIKRLETATGQYKINLERAIEKLQTELKGKIPS